MCVATTCSDAQITILWTEGGTILRPPSVKSRYFAPPTGCDLQRFFVRNHLCDNTVHVPSLGEGLQGWQALSHSLAKQGKQKLWLVSSHLGPRPYFLLNACNTLQHVAENGNTEHSSPKLQAGGLPILKQLLEPKRQLRQQRQKISASWGEGCDLNLKWHSVAEGERQKLCTKIYCQI